MTIYPAIDILNGKCVRLKKGRYDESTVYGDSPVEMARHWAAKGAKWLHVVDLDGAKAGYPVNAALIGEIAKAAGIPVQTGGGLRTEADAEALLAQGASRVILGTAAVKDPALAKRLVERFGDKIAVGIDAKDGIAAVEGWERTGSVDAMTLAKSMDSMGVSTIIFTDIATDGMLCGPNLAAMKLMAAGVRANVIASGGVAVAADVEALSKTGAAGVIIGRALYQKTVTLEECLCWQSE